MFQLSLVEHIRLSFGSAIAAFKGHTDAATRLTRLSLGGKVAALALATATMAASVASVWRGGVYPMAAAVLATATLAALAWLVAFDAHPRVYAHRMTAARLWLVCEKYRALLAEIHDETLDLPSTKERRNALLQEVAAILEHGAPADRDSYRITRAALGVVGEDAASDAAVDLYLPPSLRRASGASA